jgi:hypothetical protein
MRKITSKQKRKKQEQIKQIVVGGILVLIMFASVIGYAFQGKEDSNNSKINYNGFDFIKQDSSWIFENSFVFKYNPKETEEFAFEYELNSLEFYKNKPLYIYSKNLNAEAEIYNNIYPVAQRIQYACLDGMECQNNWPVKTCEDNFILIQEGEFSVEQKDNCLFIFGAKEDLIKISDEVLFKIIGVK